MAEIFPFRAWRFNGARVRLHDVLTQPYDQITPAMRDRYYAASPFNLCRIILGKYLPGDTEHENVYTRAAGYYSEWRNGGIFFQEERPALYAYSQEFRSPGSNAARFVRRAFIGIGKIEDYNAGVIFRHEQTLSAPKADRLQLLRATRAHFGQIFMLYEDPACKIESLLFERLPAAEIDVTDELGVRHLLWKVDNPETIAGVQALMTGKQLIIADGHHRYETALSFRNERREEAGHLNSAAYERVLMSFVSMDSEGLLILPTHRVVYGLPPLDVASLVSKLRPYFSVNPLRERVSGTTLRTLLGRFAQDGPTAMIAVTPPGDFILEARPGADAAPQMAGLPGCQRRLDIVKLHRIILQGMLGISEEDIRIQKHVDYQRSADDAIEQVRKGATAAFLMNPVTMRQLRDSALAGELMPQKSTDFYPKLLSGLTIYGLE